MIFQYMWLKGFNDFSSQVSYFTSMSRQQEFEKSTQSVTELFAITYFLAISFSVISCLRFVYFISWAGIYFIDCKSYIAQHCFIYILLNRFDNVRNKAWVASLGVFSTAQAVLSSFGLLLLMNVPFVITVASSPFLILGKILYPLWNIYYL